MSTSFIGSKKAELDTPCLVIEKKQLLDNLLTMQHHGIQNQIDIRPHCKTHKCTQMAKLQMDFGAIGISAAKVSEAEGLIKAGLSNILITSPVVTPYKIQRLINCLKKAPETLVVVDNEENLHDLNAAGASIKQKIPLLIDLDPGLGRTGVPFSKALAFGGKLQGFEWLSFKGIQCYAGNLQHITTFSKRREASLSIMQKASDLVEDLEKQGLYCEIVTGTGTGTYDIDIEASRCTEIQPGSYTVMDVEYAAIESKNEPAFTTFKPAMTLLTTVISANRKEHVTVDAGTKAIYIDPYHKPQIISHPGLCYDWGGFGDEHGIVTARDKTVLPQNGTVLELIVPHCDPTINLYDQFFIVEEGIVVDVWPLDLRGKSQ